MELDGCQPGHAVLLDKPRAGRAGKAQVPPVGETLTGSSRLEANTPDDVVILQHLELTYLVEFFIHIQEERKIPRVESFERTFDFLVAQIVVVTDKEITYM